MYYIGTKTQCLEYDRMVTEGQNYRGGTKNWANPRKYKTKWAIKKHPSYESSLPLVEHLKTES